MTFSLSTAEQSLNEVQPHVVVKLCQGREKRLQLLEQNNQLRKRDLDQRSADTCAVNSAHLDGFQKKAEANNIVAKEMTHAATKKLLGILKNGVVGAELTQAAAVAATAGDVSSANNNLSLATPTMLSSKSSNGSRSVLRAT